MKKKKQVVWTGMIIRRERDQDGLIADLARGVYLACGFLRGVSHWLDIRDSAKKPPLCLACDFEFKPDDEDPGAFVVAYSLDPAVEHMILTGICDDCQQKDDAELLSIAREGLCRVLNGTSLGFNSPTSETLH
jgi:hypothetical protein